MSTQLTVTCNSRNAAMAMAAELRLIADQLELQHMTCVSGGIGVHSNHDGQLKVTSDLVLSCREQPKVESSTETPIQLYSELETQVYQSLEVMKVNEGAYMNFDHGEEDQSHDWINTIRNRGRYPRELIGHLYEVTHSRSASGIQVYVQRLT